MFTSIMIMLVFASCQKQPTADFSTDKTSYVGGETIYVTNHSINAEFYEWELSDGQSTRVADNFKYYTDVSQSGVLTIQLTAYSKNYKKSSVMVKSVTITPAKGEATFWLSNGYITTVYLYVPGYGTISSEINRAYYDIPDCGADGCANFSNLEAGTYSYYATDGETEWEGSITVFPGRCSTMRLLYSKSKPAKNPTQPKELL
jgi:hypothetical protein